MRTRDSLVPRDSAVAQGAAKPAATGPLANAAQVVQDATQHAPSSSRTTNAQGVASLVLGILALLVAWVPLLGLLAWPLGGVGLILGLVGLILAARNRKWGTTSAIAGLATNGAAMVVALVVTLWAARGLEEAARRAQEAEVANAARQDVPGLPPPASVPAGPAQPVDRAPDGTFAGQDRNGDGRLNADEVPDEVKVRFAEFDANGDGYVDKTEWDRAVASAPDTPAGRGKVIARRVFTAADDFVVDVWHNGRRVADDKRSVVGETFGATTEKMDIEVREGDWLVFNVANNRFRWNGACYFGAAGVNDTEPQIGFVSDPSDGRWSYCDDPARVPGFIAHPRYLADQTAVAPVNPWGGGDGELKSRVPGWNGRPVWSRERTTWLKFVASSTTASGSGPASSSVPVSSPAKPEAPSGTREDEPGDTAVAPPASPASISAPAPVALMKRATLTGHPALVHCVSVSPDGRKVVSGSATQFDSASSRLDPNTLIVWDLADQGKTRVVIPIEQSVTSLAITPNSKSVVVTTENGLCVFDLKTGRRSATLRGPARANTLCTAISPDGKIAAGGFTTKEVVLWNLNTGKPLRTLRGHTMGVIALAFSPDGKQLASGSQDNSIRLWDVTTGRVQRTLTAKGASSPVTCVVYDPDGSRLASVNSGDQPQFWDPASGRHLLSLGGDEVLSYRFICISADGRRLATASLDPAKMKWLVVLWDAATGRRLASAEDGDGQVNAVAFTPDGATLVSTGGKTVNLWNITQR